MSVAGSYQTPSRRVEAVCSRVGRNPNEITLVAVTKTKPVEMIREAIAVGITHFGENRVQEPAGKITLIKAAVTWHLVAIEEGKRKEEVL